MQLTKEQFVKLIDYLDGVSSACTDVIIRNGKIRQMSDDRTLIYDVDTELPELNANLQMVKGYVNIFKVFVPEDDKETVTLESNLENLTLILSDNESTVRFTMGDEKYLNTRFIDDTMISNIIIKALYNFPLSPRVLKKVTTLSKDFATETLNIKAEDNRTTFSITSASKTKHATILKIEENIGFEPGEYITQINLFNFKYTDPKIEVLEVGTKNSNRALRIVDGNISILAIVSKKS